MGDPKPFSCGEFKDEKVCNKRSLQVPPQNLNKEGRPCEMDLRVPIPQRGCTALTSVYLVRSADENYVAEPALFS